MPGKSRCHCIKGESWGIYNSFHVLSKKKQRNLLPEKGQKRFDSKRPNELLLLGLCMLIKNKLSKKVVIIKDVLILKKFMGC